MIKNVAYDSSWYEVIDNFLPEEEFNELYNLLLLPTEKKGINAPLKGDSTKQVPWRYQTAIVGGGEEKEDWRLFYLTHMAYNHTQTSPFCQKIWNYVENRLDVKSLMRMIINMYPNTETLKEHGMHFDYPFPHTAGILSMNTCDGYTKIESKSKVRGGIELMKSKERYVKIDSVANRMLLFDASNPHTSSTTTNKTVRVNINFNYF